MRYAAIDKCECINAIGWGATLYVQGCSRHCKGCFNQETWDFDKGTLFTSDIIDKIVDIYKKRPEYTHFVVEGGEPLEECNWKELNSLLANIRLHLPNIKIWIYTGYTYEKLLSLSISSKNGKYLLPIITSLADVIVDGPFIQEQKDITLAYRGSKNQRIIDTRATAIFKEITLYDI